MYHPDRLAYYQKELEKQYALGTAGNLAQFTHIFQTLEYVATKAVHISAPDSKLFQTEVQEYYDFKSALKHKEYGNLHVIYQDHDFAQIEGELELSGYYIDDLSGIELCIHLIALDLSNNEIFDITNLRFLHLLEELDLSYNKVYSIDILSELHYLKHLDLAFNNVEDISSLLHLGSLEYVNIIGNNIPEFQINALKGRGVIIAH